MLRAYIISKSVLSPKTFDQLAELHVAGLFAEKGWNVYFPHRDKGFDFVAMKFVQGKFIIRPVQVKGKYPEEGTKDHDVYGYVGPLTQRDPEMVLAIPYFERGAIPILKHVAFMPDCMIRPRGKGFRCEPAKFIKGSASPRGEHKIFFDDTGLRRLEIESWSQEKLR